MSNHLRSILGFCFFALTLGALTTLVHFYFYRRLVRAARSKAARRAGGALLAVLAIVLVAGPAGQRMGLLGPIGVALAKAGYLWMAVGFYLLVCLGAIDLVRVTGRIFERARQRRGRAPEPDDTVPNPARRRLLAQSGLVGAGLALPTSGYGILEAFGPPAVTETTVRLPGLPSSMSGFTIALLSDIHAGAWVDRRFVSEIVARTNALRPDMVAIAGDLVDGSVEELAETVAPIASLRSRAGTFFVIGNHELYSGVEPWDAHLRSIGLRVLRNAREAFEGLDILGCDDWSARRRGIGRGYDLERALAGRDPDRPAILLAHQPRGFEQAASRGVGLQLSGHTHGGQIWPWTIVVGLAYHPYVAGLYSLGRSSLYVSRGCGFWGPPVRVGAPPEIAHIALI